MTAFFAAAGQYVAATRGSHSGEETVGFNAVQFLGLVSAFHGKFLLKRKTLIKLSLKPASDYSRAAHSNNKPKKLKYHNLKCAFCQQLKVS